MRRGGRHFEEANTPHAENSVFHGCSVSETFSLVNIARQTVKGGGNETWTGLLSQVDDVYRSRKKILQVDGY